MAHPPQREWVYLGPSDTPFYKHPCPVHGPDAVRYASSEQCRECHIDKMNARHAAKKKVAMDKLYAGMKLEMRPAAAAGLVEQGVAEWDGKGGIDFVETDLTDARVVKAKRPCKHCGSLVRYRANGKCVTCQRERNNENNEHYRQKRKKGV